MTPQLRPAQRLISKVGKFALLFICSSSAERGLSQVPESEPPPSTQPSGTSVTAGAYGAQPPLADTLSAPPPGPRFAGTSQLAGILPATQTALSGGEGLLRWGPVQVYPRFFYQLSYGNGLQSAPGDRANTLINQISPGVLLRLGSHWSVDYSPNLQFYSDRRFRDTTDHTVTLAGAANYEDWNFGLSQSYASTSQPLIETGAQTDQEAYATALSAGYILTSKIGLQFTLNQNLRFIDRTVATEPLTDSREWSTMEWINYQYISQLSFGLGIGATYDDLSIGSDMVSEQLQGRIVWRPGTKLTITATGGMDYRQFISSDTPDLLSPTFSVVAAYRIFDVTSLSFSAGHSITPSYFENAVTEGTTVNFGLTQRLLGRLNLGINAGYSSSTYHHTGPTTTSNLSNYDSTSFRVDLGTQFLQHGIISGFYQLAYNSSGAQLYNYSTTQFGFNLAYRF